MGGMVDKQKIKFDPALLRPIGNLPKKRGEEGELMLVQRYRKSWSGGGLGCLLG